MNTRNKKDMQRRIEVFQCRRCGTCCTGEGFVNLEKGESQPIADALGLSLEEFQEKYTLETAGYERWLIDGKGEDEPCVLLERDDSGLASCRVEGPAKPSQCKAFPRKWRRRGFEKWCAAFKEEKK